MVLRDDWRSGSGDSRTGSSRRRRSGNRARALDPSFTCANVFWWFNMYSPVDMGGHPAADVPRRRPQAPRHLDAPATLRDELAARLCSFRCSSSGARARDQLHPLDCRRGKRHRSSPADPHAGLPAAPRLRPSASRAGTPRRSRRPAPIDEVCGDLIDALRGRGARVVVLSEYGIRTSNRPCTSTARCAKRAVAVRDELGGELLDAGASARVRCGGPSGRARLRQRPRAWPRSGAVSKTPGVDAVLDADGKRAIGLDHRVRRSRRRRRAGRLVHLLLLARRAARAGFRAHGRDPPKARLRPGRALPRSGDSTPRCRSAGGSPRRRWASGC